MQSAYLGVAHYELRILMCQEFVTLYIYGGESLSLKLVLLMTLGLFIYLACLDFFFLIEKELCYQPIKWLINWCDVVP